MAKEINRKLVLEDGTEYYGTGFGSMENKVLQVVFNTAVVGYQEMLTDPSCTDLMVVMTYPLIGNYGITDEDNEAKNAWLGGLCVREYNDNPSNFRYTKTLAEVMEENRVPGICGIDTRALTRRIRENGSCRAMICDASMPKEEALATIANTPVPHDAVARVSCRKTWYARTSGAKFRVVAVDCGIKLGIIRALNARGCNVTVVPYNVSAEEILALQPDGVLISNGPGAPEDVPAVAELVKALRGKLPIFGISLGHLLIAMAYGAKVDAMKVGHHGGNHAVLNLATDKMEITAQGHGFVVNEKSLAGTALQVTHRNVLDGSVEGIACKAEKVFSVQYNPESAPGPQDSGYLFDNFIELMKTQK